MQRIVILGGGFAGVKCARTLRKLLPRQDYEIIVFNRENHMVFHPLLAEVASAAVQPKDVGAPLRQLLQHVQCRTEDVLNIDLEKGVVEYEAHDGSRRQMSYDQLVLCCGSSPNLGLIPGMDDHAFGLKTIGDGLAIQAHVMQMMEKAEVCDDPERRRWYLSFIVVGGGFSGVEVAGEINDLVRKSRKFFSNISEGDISVSIIHAGDSILPEVNPSLREFAQKKMEQTGVRMCLKSAASRATSEGVTINGGILVRGGTIVCTIGNTTQAIIARLNVKKERGRLVTEPDMSVPGHKNVWAIGDCAAIINAEDGKLSPPVAQFAERQGTQVAHNIVHRLRNEPTKPFTYKMLGQMCSIGGHSAVAEMMGMRISGFLAWFIWRGVYLMKLPSIAQQIKVGIEWGFDLIFPRTLAHLRADQTRRIGRAFYGAGDFIFKQGDVATDFYVIEHGEVEVLKDEDGKHELIAILGPGDFFGEAALMDSRPRNATVRARTDVEVTLMGRNVFTQISDALGPLRDAVAGAIKRRTNVLKNMEEFRHIMDMIPLKTVMDALPGAPLHIDSSVEEAISRINKHKLDFCCVCDQQGHLLGLVTRSDLLRAIDLTAVAPEKAQSQIKIKDIMMKDPIAIPMDESTTVAMLTMREHGLKRLPVFESNESRILRGYVRIECIMDHVVSRMNEAEQLVPSNTQVTRELDMPPSSSEYTREIDRPSI